MSGNRPKIIPLPTYFFRVFRHTPRADTLLTERTFTGCIARRRHHDQSTRACRSVSSVCHHWIRCCRPVWLGPCPRCRLNGGTIEALCTQHPERILLSGIDCPEKGQACCKLAMHAAQLAFSPNANFHPLAPCLNHFFSRRICSDTRVSPTPRGHSPNCLIFPFLMI